MKILITGISGFAARHFIEFLSETGESFDIAGVYNSNKPDFTENEYNNVHCTFYKINLVEAEEIKALLLAFRPDYILHLAAKSSVADSWINPTECILENTRMFLNIIEPVSKEKIPCRILSVGSSEEYGKVQTTQETVPESCCVNPVSPYGAARAMQQKLVDIYSNNYGIDILHARAFNHLGKYQKGNFVISSFAKQIATQLLAGKDRIELSVGDVSVVRDFTHVKDVVRAYYELLLNGKNGETYNVCSAKGYVLKDVIEMFSAIIGIPVNYQSDSRNMRPNENKKIIGSFEKIQQEIGWQPQLSLEHCLKDLLAYWKVVLSDQAPSS